MKLGPVAKIDKRNETASKNWNCDIIAFFPIYNQFGAIQKPDSGCIVCKIYIFIKSNLLSYKNWKQ